MGKRIAKIVLGIALIPLCAGFTGEFVSLVLHASYKGDAPYLFLAGSLAYLTLHILFKKPIFSYVIAHELTHALFAVLSGGSVKSLHASDRGGKVTVTKSNFLITLAPYFFPLYTILAMLFYGAALSARVGVVVTNALIVLSGAAFTFHGLLTFIFLHEDQTDIAEQGAIFSYPLIYLFNISFAALVFDVYLAKDMEYLRFFTGGIIKSADLVMFVANKGLTLIR